MDHLFFGYFAGVIALTAVLVVAFQASVTHLIPLYAIGVFTSFTLSQAGMAKHHVTHKEKGWKVGLVINGTGALATGEVTQNVARLSAPIPAELWSELKREGLLDPAAPTPN